HFVDGQRGDDDLTANGIIVEPGGPALGLPPVVAADAYAVPEGDALLVIEPGVLGNDISPTGAPLTAALVSGPAHGTLTLSPDGSFTYAPAPDFRGTDHFSYRARAGGLDSDVTDVTLTVHGVPDPQVAWVTALYRDLLGRSPEPIGLGAWVALLQA